MKKALTVANILNQKVERIPFEGEWYEAFRQPQNKGVWFVWGSSGGGKSYFVMQLAKELAKYKKVLYNVLEEETDDTDFIDRTAELKMNEVSENYLAQRYEYNELVEYLQKRNSPDVIIIDSLTYFLNSFEEYMKLKRQFKNKIFIFTGHAQGANPRSELEVKVQFDAKMKIFVNGYLASCKGRTIGSNGGQFITWKDGYEKVRGENN
jgi:archaellum biogenesis ATPase FlaH